MKIINRREFCRGTFLLIVVSLILMVFGIGNTLADWVIEPTKAGFVPVKGGRIWYRMNGNEHFAKGKTPLIVIHGGPAFRTTTYYRWLILLMSGPSYFTTSWIAAIPTDQIVL